MSLGTHPHVGDYPRKAVSLHFYFAKLLVCSHVFRGLSSDVAIDPVPAEFLDTAYMAIESAKSIIRLVVGDSDLQIAFVGVPHYFHTMIAYACSFLIKTATKYRKHIEIDVKIVFQMIGDVVALCKSTHCAQYHLVHWIGKGLQIMLSSCINGTPENERMPSPSGSQTVNTVDEALPTLGASVRNSGSNYAMDTETNMGSVWDAARQAAIGSTSDNFPLGGGYNQMAEDTPAVMAYSQSWLYHTDVLQPQFDSSLDNPNWDHLGLGLGLL